MIDSAACVREVRGNRSNIVVSLQIVQFSWFICCHSLTWYGDAIQRIHYTLIWELPLDQLEVLIFAERYMVYTVREVKLVALHLQIHHYILICVRWDVEIARDTIYCEKALQLAALFLIHLFFDLVD